ncbi:MAG TPA: hypothetical protein VIF88_14280 [Methylocystis sp.]|jgi:hypothetical protein
MGFLRNFFFLRELRATKNAFSKLPRASRQVAMHEFSDLVVMSRLSTSKDAFGAFVIAAIQRRQELARVGMATPEWVGACLAESYLIMRHMAWGGDSKWQSELAKLESWAEQFVSDDKDGDC